MTDQPKAAPSLFPRDQYRMLCLQVFNWGTFSGLHEIPIANQGFLFVGPSGAGKSTLLDAFSSLLIPPRWLDFNAAAREAERTGKDRNLVTYVRGAWGERTDGESGEIGARFLRTETTWSALALSFRNQSGQCVTLVQLFWIRGKSLAVTDVKRQYLVLERELNLRELENFDLDVRKLKRSFPDAFVRDDFSSYCERFRRILGIESELALRLLHKTQSAKNLGDLNEFLRDFMLDRPETFAAADRLVTEFAELNAAHQAVVTAREQILILEPARKEHLTWLESGLAVDASQNLQQGLDAYLREKKSSLLSHRIEELRTEAEGLSEAVQASHGELNAFKGRYEALLQQRRKAGGDRIEEWELSKAGLESQRADRSRKRTEMQSSCAKLGETPPETPEELVSLASRARREAEGWKEAAEHAEAKRFELKQERQTTEAAFQTAVTEVRALKAQASNIPADMLGFRRQLAADIGAPESELPFTGELLEVREEENGWQGAIERALRGFALSILVGERWYTSFSKHVNETPLGRRLVYHRVGTARAVTRAPGSSSLVHKIRVKEGPYHDWLAAELANSFDYTCAETLAVFRASEFALTREGQIRRGRSRHEKDDTFAVDYRRRWVLGFSNRAKLELFEKEAHELSQKIEKLRREIESSKSDADIRSDRYPHCVALMNLRWQEVDVTSLVQQIAQIDQDLVAARSGNASLRRIEQQIKEAKTAITEAEEKENDLKVKQKLAQNKLNDAMKILDVVQLQKRSDLLAERQRSGLEERLQRIGERAGGITLENLESLGRKASEELSREVGALKEERSLLLRAIEDRFASFKRNWPADAADVDTTLDSAQDFLAKLDRLEKDGLPAHEDRFFDLLQTQSNQNLAALSTHLSHASKEIADRLELVNEGLREAPFSPDTYLRIFSDDRQLPEVRELKQEMRQVLSNAWDGDRAGAESRFLVLRKLVERLGSQDNVDRRWRDTVLDVRQHMDFVGRELDAAGNEIEVYRSGSGKSGGQRQKLATTCLAAALRYQLGGHERGVPAYAPVVLDEAFDKADNEFTALVMNIFANFGFQMIVATPLKSVMTLEPFIGGACLVAIRERKHSGVLLVEYDTEQKRLLLQERNLKGAEGRSEEEVPAETS